jgi:polar amino acid transport system permease protein
MNEFIVLIKESSIVFAIGLKDIMTRYRLVSSATYTAFEPLIVAGVLYYVLIRIASFIGSKIEGRLKNAAGE